ncbi:hypothetical protein PIB30_040353 [Stylosanthes scabra]|uniref:Uncharacterized protein n=1 Tax=Stylosanthes scabra TaxID=79078 RepID=A0ABU6VFQ4_9FABA|nr:hypothetical protein [Stylosanthes scabra]
MASGVVATGALVVPLVGGLQIVEHMPDLHLGRALDLLENAVLNLVVANCASEGKTAVAMDIVDVEKSVNLVGYADVENDVAVVVRLTVKTMVVADIVVGVDIVTAMGNKTVIVRSRDVDMVDIVAV